MAIHCVLEDSDSNAFRRNSLQPFCDGEAEKRFCVSDKMIQDETSTDLLVAQNPCSGQYVYVEQYCNLFII